MSTERECWYKALEDFSSVCSLRDYGGCGTFLESDSSEENPPSRAYIESGIQQVFSSAPPSCRRKLPLTKFCKRHSNDIRYFCISCSALACPKCISSEMSCYFKPLNRRVERGQVEGLYNHVLEEHVLQMEDLKSCILKTQYLFKASVENIKKEIEEAVNERLAKIEENRQKLYSQLDQIQKSKNTSWEKQIELCNITLNELKNDEKSRFPDLRKINNFGIIVSLTRKELNFIENSDISFVKSIASPCNLGKIKSLANPNNSFLRLPLKSFTNKFNSSHLFIRDDMSEILNDSDFVVSATLYYKNNESVYLNIRNLKNGCFKIMYYPLLSGTYTMCVYLDGYEINGNPYKFVVEDANTADEDKTGVTFFAIQPAELESRPWGICSDNNGRILVSDRRHHCILIFSEDGQFVLKIGREGRENGEFFRPAGIAVDNSLCRIVVADKDNHRIQVLSLSGCYIFQFGQEGSGDGLFFYPWDVAVNSLSQIAVSDSKNRRVQLFDKNGSFMREFSFHDHILSGIEQPRGLTFRSDNSLYITDFDRHKIILLDKKFDKVKAFGHEGSDVCQFSRPQGIALGADGTIFVSDGKNNRIQVFQENGTFLGIVKGTGELKLESPQGIHVLPDGRIIVAELMSNRVKILAYDHKKALQESGVQFVKD